MPSMRRDEEVEVLWGSWSQQPPASRKVTDREVGAERSGERIRGSTNRNRIRGAADQGERACDREALATKGQAASIRRSCGERHGSYLGSARLTPERATPTWRSEQSAEAVVAEQKLARVGQPEQAGSLWRGEGPNGREGETTVSLGGARRQMSKQLELPLESRGEALRGERSGEALTAAHGIGRSGTDHLMERVVERGNVQAALKRVRQNKGNPGMDGRTVEELRPYLAEHWEAIRAQLLDGFYQPTPVRAVEIPKRGGGVRTLGIPTVLDRLIQQSLLQVLQPMVDPTFSEHSHGFRPGRNAHHAVCEAQRYIQDGKRVVVDVDLEQFFDRVNHAVLMGRLAQRIGDKRMLGLIRRYLEAGIMANGVVMERDEGTPQGGPLSPLLANVLLDDVDKELAQRGLSVVRYADDLNLYVRSRRAGEDAMQTLRRLYARLRLRINEAKSAVARPQDRTFLGYSFRYAKGGEVRRCIAPRALEVMKERVRAMTARNGGRNLESVFAELRSYLTGWKAYFRLAESLSIFKSLDEWIRHRLRAVQLKQWRRGPTVYRELRARGVSERVSRVAAAHARCWWRIAAHRALHTALPMSYYDRMGVPRLADSPQPTEPPDADPHVRWCGRGLTGRTRQPLSRFISRFFPRASGDGRPDLIENSLTLKGKSVHTSIVDLSPDCIFTKA